MALKSLGLILFCVLNVHCTMTGGGKAMMVGKNEIGGIELTEHSQTQAFTVPAPVDATSPEGSLQAACFSSFRDDGVNVFDTQLNPSPANYIVNNPSFHQTETNLRDHKGERRSTRKALEEIFQLTSELHTRLNHMKSYRGSRLDPNSLLKHPIKNLSNIIKTLEQANRELLVFKQLKFSELETDEIPLVFAWRLYYAPSFLKARLGGPRNVGDLIVKDLKRVINLHGFMPRSERQDAAGTSEKFLLSVQRAGLKTIDFLIKKNLVRSESVQRIFQDPKVAESIMIYSYDCFKDDLEQSILAHGSPYITEHWYWPLLHDSFRVLDENAKILINTSLLLKRLRYHYKNAPNSLYRQDQEWVSFSYSFDLERLIPKYPSSFAGKNSLDKDPDELYPIVRTIINILLIPGEENLASNNKEAQSKDQLEFLIVDTLDLIKKYGSKGIVGKVAHTLLEDTPRPEISIDADQISFANR